MKTKIQELYQEKRKARDTVAAGVLSVVLGEFSRADQQKHDNEFCIRVIKKLIASNEDSVEAFRKRHQTGDLGDDQAKVDQLLAEVAVLNGLLPKQLTQEQLQQIINSEITPDMSKQQVFAHMKAHYAGCYDGGLFNRLLAASHV